MFNRRDNDAKLFHAHCFGWISHPLYMRYFAPWDHFLFRLGKLHQIDAPHKGMKNQNSKENVEITYRRIAVSP
jgi:hypothetical protein